MKRLEEYIQNQFKDIQAEINEINSKVEDAIFTILKTQQKDQWPYLAAHEKTLEPPENYSFSTNAMILCMLHLADNKVCHEQLYPRVSITTNFTESSKKKRRTALCKLFKEIVALNQDNSNKKFVTKSNTYGDNDPSSLLWISNLIGIYNDAEDKSSININPSDIKNIEDTIFKITDDTLQEKILSTSANFQLLNIERYKQSTNAFVVLKIFLLAKALYEKKPSKVKNFPQARPVFFSFFEQRLHQQLSYNSIPDSRFDPAELVFCLEGISLFNEFKPNDETFERALEVIGQHQSTAPYWRPINPIYATQQGQILLPLSIEVANSLLRTCLSLDKSRDTPMFFSNHLPLFQRYYRWLKAQLRKITIFDSNKKFDLWGWESEHVGNPHEIHLWQTSEIATYLMLYNSALQLHIGSETLNRANLLVEKANEDNKDKIDELIDPFPRDYINQKYPIYSIIRDNFIKPRADPQSYDPTAPCSFLLYGPPGTGKTFLTKCIADKLNWRHITVTPSDFLAGGSGEVEARAKAIFQCLEQQQEVVILFDEIDHFLLDRESDEYHNQTGIFQFMTPGMLPKLQRLRDKAEKNNFIFVIATNYEERIDPAIKRLGRIDEKLPLLPPCNKVRQTIIENIIFGDKRKLSEKEKQDWVEQNIKKLAGLFPPKKHWLEQNSKELADLSLPKRQEWIKDNTEGLTDLSPQKKKTWIKQNIKGIEDLSFSKKKKWIKDNIQELADLTPLYTYKELSNFLKNSEHKQTFDKPESIYKTKLTQYIPRFFTQQKTLKQLEQTPYKELVPLLFLACEQEKTLRYLRTFLGEHLFKKPGADILKLELLENLKRYPQIDPKTTLTKTLEGID
ncbi:ATP-binding protein [Desulfobaculum bizertense]|uniref:ATPase family associated with various cellular activities (AAA) n=1 Tax=Desulfobaculum bizertense DSM 18034 TaxID=1121442 RepID=A0A1T4W177_9BACT|nr:ATP-binding protein [Desulfobaculum bizertense]SKA70889.1 ATPase family associated with various cellular activities (AAA) [Desulfobaculum bizertense DSM 18034]